MDKPPRPLVWAHRGASKSAPENTLAAFRAALEAGADGVELDVHLTSDGHVVVIHDATLNRTTSGKGPIGEAPLNAIRQLDAGSWHSAQFAGEQVPILKEVLELVMTWPGGGKRVLIELKGPFSGLPGCVKAALRGFCLLHEAPAYSGLPMAVAEILKSYHAQVEAGLILAQSFHRPYLDQLPSMVPKLQLLYLSASASSGCLEREEFEKGNLRLAGVALRHSTLSATTVSHLHTHHKYVFAWTIDSEAHLSAAVLAGVDGLITNRPDVAVNLLYNGRPTELDRLCPKTK